MNPGLEWNGGTFPTETMCLLFAVYVLAPARLSPKATGQTLFDKGRLTEIHDYCRCDVLDTYFVFLRTRLLLGQMNRDQEQALVEKAREWVAEKHGTAQILASYLEICRQELNADITS